jgi:hypothetical protein
MINPLDRVNLDYFKHEELMCRATGEVILAPGFGKKLDELRGGCGFPLTINSCCRSAEHNRKIGGHERSLHVHDKPYHPTGGCMAVDIDTTRLSFDQKMQLLNQAYARGWAIGIAKTFFHFDRRKDIGMQPTLYFY